MITEYICRGEMNHYCGKFKTLGEAREHAQELVDEIDEYIIIEKRIIEEVDCIFPSE